MGIALANDADKKIDKLISKKTVQSIYKSAQEEVVNCAPIKFVDDVQRLVVEVAAVISEVAVSDKFADDNYQAAIKYLCKKILKENALLSDFESYKSNVDADRKKPIEEIDSEGIIYYGANLYNALINMLVEKFKITSLKSICITAEINLSKKAKQDKKAEKQEKKIEKQDKKAEKQEKKVEKQEKKVEEVEQPKKQEKKVEEPKKQEKKVEEVEQPKKSNSKDKARAVYVDEGVGILTVELLRGDGWYEKGFSKKDFFQCVIEINFAGNGKYDLKGALINVNSLKIKNVEIHQLIKGDVISVGPGRNDLDIEIDRQGLRKFLEEANCDNVNRLSTEVGLSVTATVKSGPKAKKLPCDLSCVF